MSNYNIDLIVGNLLGKKDWVRIKMNSKKFHEKPPV